MTMELQRHGAAAQASPKEVDKANNRTVTPELPKTKEIPTATKKRNQLFGRMALNARLFMLTNFGVTIPTKEERKARKDTKESKSTNGEKPKSRLQKIGDAVLARVGKLALPHTSSTHAEKRPSLDDEQPSHPNAAPLGDGNNESDVALEPANAAEVTDTPEQADAPQEPGVSPETDRVRSPRIESLFDPYEIATKDGKTALNPDGTFIYMAALDKDGEKLTSENGTVLRKVKENGAEIQFFDTSYLSREEDDTTEPTPLQELTRTRAAYAEASFGARKGGLISSKNKHHGAFVDAEEAYQAARSTYFDTVFDKYSESLSAHEKNEFIVAFNEREQGAMAGEEAHHYMTAVNDKAQKSRFQRLTERYNELGTGKKVGLGIGVAAVAGFGIAASGIAAASAGAALGATYGTRLARSMFTSNANRVGKIDSKASKLASSKAEARKISQQMESVTFAGDQNESNTYLASLNTTTDTMIDDGLKIKYDGTASKLFAESSKRHANAIEAKRKAETSAKRRAGAIAVGTTIVGSAAGYGLHHIAESTGLTDAIREHVLPSWAGGTNSHAQSLTENGGDGYSADKTPSQEYTPDKPVEAPKPEITPEISAEAKHLYGNLAGQAFELKLDEGDTVWGSLRSEVLAKNPGMSFQEADRITGNMVQHFTTGFEAKNPGYTINYPNLQPGDTLTFNLK